MKHIWLSELAEYMRQIEECHELDMLSIKRLNELKKQFAELGETALIVLVDDVLRENLELQEVNALPDIDEDEVY